MNDLLWKRYFGQLHAIDIVKENNYWPQSIEVSDSKYHILATTLILEQAPG